MLTENPVSTTKRFIPSWRNAHPDRLREELKSVFNETNHQPDPLSFIVRDGGLIDPATGKAFDFARATPVEIAEGKVWDDLREWANSKKTKKGAKSVWLSALLEPESYNIGGEISTAGSGYPSNKAILYEVDFTDDVPPVKILRSTTILFDAPKEHCLKVAEKINPLMANIKDPEFLRSKLFKLKKNFNIIDILEAIGETDRKTVPTPSQETINYFVKEIKSGRSAESIVLEMRLRGIIGDFSISCPLSNGSTILNFSNKEKENWAWHKGNCVIPAPDCGKEDVEVGPCGVCRECQKKFDENPNHALAA